MLSPRAALQQFILLNHQDEPKLNKRQARTTRLHLLPAYRGLKVEEGGVEVENGGLLVSEDGAVISVSSTSVDPLAIYATSG